MIWIIVPLIIIAVVLLFGPVVAGLTMLAAAIGAGLFATFFLVLFGLWCFVFLGGAAGWCIWWVCDPKGAMRAMREAQTGRRQD